MKLKALVATSAFVALALAMPASAQVTEGGDGSADDNVALTDLLNGSLNGNALDSNNQDNDRNGNNRNNDSSTTILGLQVLAATATGDGLDARTLDDGPGGYRSGNNVIDGGAFANFAGIMNLSSNTGTSSIAQSATNVAAQGTVTFGSAD